MLNDIQKAAKLLIQARHAIAFTGAGISVESGIPPFRGEKGIWNKYDPQFLEIHYFFSHPQKSWEVILEIFYTHFEQSKPNPAHLILAELEKRGIIKALITQNIDNLHQEAGSQKVIEFHGNSKKIICVNCGKTFTTEVLNHSGFPWCPECKGLLKPDFVFFGEQIPAQALTDSFAHAKQADVVLVIGSTGEVFPAAQVPIEVHRNKGKVIEVNPGTSNFTYQITDIFLKGKAGEIMPILFDEINAQMDLT